MWQDEVQKWKDYEQLDPVLKETLNEMEEDELEDAFGAQISFGTAGMRAVIAPGTNRMNIYTIRQATSGLVQLLQEAGVEAMQRGVAIAYDSRHMSKEFAEEAARVLGTAGVHVYLYESLRPTPVLSFAVRHLHTYAGIMITASHNPAAYNGYKVYGADGGQMPPEEADRLIAYVREAADPFTLELETMDALLQKGILEIIGDSVDQAYLKEMQTVTLDQALIKKMAPKVKIVFTPLHGAGGYMGRKALKQAGFTEVEVVKDQAEPDGDFPTLDSPNPEDRAAFDLALDRGKQVDADIILATDPDADRLGAMIRTASGDYQLLTGNQIACLMLAYIITARKAQGNLPANGVAVKSIVSTHLANKIVEANELEMVEVLTGFKFIAEKIQEYEETGEHTFLLGFEESYGYLIQPFVRDKDAIQALVLLAELTAYHKQAGATLGDALENLYKKYGYFEERTLAVAYPGIEGQAQMANMMERIRETCSQSLAGRQVMEAADYLSGVIRDAEGHTKVSPYPPSNALKYVLEDQSWVAFRPSGTEPKIKLYLGVEGKSREEVKQRADEIEEAIVQLTKV